MAINRTNFNLLVDDDGSNLVGTIWDKAHIKDVILDPVDAALLGDPWTRIPFNAANFVAVSGGVWTVGAGQIDHIDWLRLDRSVLFLFRLVGIMTLSAPSPTLQIILPAPIPLPSASTPYPSTTFHYYMTGAIGAGLAELQPTGRLNLLRDVAGTPFPAFTSAYLMGQIAYPI